MFIVLPPSETKTHGGDGSPLNFAELSFPELTPIRKSIAADLQALPVDAAVDALGLSEKNRAEAHANTQLFSSPTTPAIERYSGVLYDALSPAHLPDSARGRLAIGSALFGIVGAQDPIPHYRLSGNTKLPVHASAQSAAAPAAPTMKKRWGRSITQALQSLQEAGELIVDLRSGAYRNLGTVPGAVTVRVESVRPDGTRKVVSHFNKHYKGLLARELALAPGADAARNAHDVAELARAAAFEIEEQVNSDTTSGDDSELTLVV